MQACGKSVFSAEAEVWSDVEDDNDMVCRSVSRHYPLPVKRYVFPAYAGEFQDMVTECAWCTLKTVSFVVDFSCTFCLSFQAVAHYINLFSVELFIRLIDKRPLSHWRQLNDLRIGLILISFIIFILNNCYIFTFRVTGQATRTGTPSCGRSRDTRATWRFRQQWRRSCSMTTTLHVSLWSCCSSDSRGRKHAGSIHPTATWRWTCRTGLARTTDAPRPQWDSVNLCYCALRFVHSCFWKPCILVNLSHQKVLGWILWKSKNVVISWVYLKV